MIKRTLNELSGDWAIIPARAGSKGLRRKAECEVGGIPLLGRTILAARAALSLERILVSTDDPAYARLAREYGAEVPFLRPASLATDTTPITDVVDHLLASLGPCLPRQFVLLQPTSPLLLGSDIDEARARLTAGVDAVTSVCRTEVQPDWLRIVGEAGWLRPVGGLAVPQHTPRQSMPETFRLNGAIYWIRTCAYQREHTFLPTRCHPYCMPQERSLDIDCPRDLALAQWALEQLSIEHSQTHTQEAAS